MHGSYKQVLKVIFKKISSIFLSGFFTLLPIIVTIALFHFTFQLVKRWLAPLSFCVRGTCLQDIPHAEIIVAFLVIFLFGLILRFFVLRSVVHGIEHAIGKLPLIRPVYAGVKQLVAAFSFQDKMSFKEVVFIEFPAKGTYAIGFVTSETITALSPDTQRQFFNVFVPTTPNPTTGFFVVVEQKDVVVADLTRQEAMALIISGGIIQPERFANKRT